MCNINDIGIALEDNITKSDIPTQPLGRRFAAPPAGKEFEPNIYIYDNYPSGIGFSQVLYEKYELLLRETLKTLRECECRHGCPSCVGPNINTRSRHKEYADFILQLLLQVVVN
jgi:DEAD/DEAH box helicase domain-containing protein